MGRYNRPKYKTKEDYEEARYEAELKRIRILDNRTKGLDTFARYGHLGMVYYPDKIDCRVSDAGVDDKYPGYNLQERYSVGYFLRHAFELHNYQHIIESYYKENKKIQEHPLMIKELKKKIFIVRLRASILERRLIWYTAPRSLLWKSHSRIPTDLMNAKFIVGFSEYENNSLNFHYEYSNWDDPNSVYIVTKNEAMENWELLGIEKSVLSNRILEMWKILSGDQFEQSGWSKLKGEY